MSGHQLTESFEVEYEALVLRADEIRRGDHFALYGRVERVNRDGTKFNCYDQFDQRIAQIPVNSTGWHIRREVTKTCPGCGVEHLGEHTGTEWCRDCCEAALAAEDW